MIKLTRVNSIEDLKKLENGTVKSSFVKPPKGREYWTVDVPLIAESKRNGVTLINKWFINYKNELIYSVENDYLNLEMYLGITTPSSWVSDLYLVEKENNNERD